MSVSESEFTMSKMQDSTLTSESKSPNKKITSRFRRTASYWMIACAISAVTIGILSSNTSLIVSSILIFLISIYFFYTSWPLRIDESDALVIAAQNSPFAIGPASAQLGFLGWQSKPVWRIVVFSFEDIPTQRGMVEVDAISSKVLSTYFELNNISSDKSDNHA